MRRAAHEKPEAIERLERFRILLMEYRDIWHCAPDKQEFLNLWARSKNVEARNAAAKPSIVVSPCDRPLAAPGLTSYRCRGAYSWIMIGARNHDDAWREAQRSSDHARRETLEVWDGACYRNVIVVNDDKIHAQAIDP